MPPSLTPQEFVAKWRKVELKERSASQSHFIDLCFMIGHPTPVEDDPTGQRFTFEVFHPERFKPDRDPDKVERERLDHETREKDERRERRAPRARAFSRFSRPFVSFVVQTFPRRRPRSAPV